VKVLKGFGTGILSFLLFLSLSVFGIAFMLNSTLLNPDFVADELDKLDVTALVKELTEEQISEQLPEEVSFIKEDLYDIISEQEPWLKEQLNTAIYSGYDYFLGKSDRLEVLISLESLKASLRDSLWQTFHEYISSDLSNLPEDVLKPYLDRYYQEFIGQIPEEYLPSELAGLPEDELKPYLDQYYQEFVEELPIERLPPELIAQLEEQIEPYFDQYYQEFADQIPSEYEISESSLSPEAMEQIREVKSDIGIFQTAYNYLIVFMVVLVLGIILINRDVRVITRSLGISLLIYGAFEFAGIYVARHYMTTSLPMPSDIPVSLQTWLSGFTSDLLAPLQAFSLGLLIGGVVLLVVSFVYRRRSTEDEIEPDTD
jgi:hypothetical protein